MGFQPELIEPKAEYVDRYWRLFVNQPAYSIQRDDRENPADNRFYRPRLYFRSEEYKRLTMDTVRRHLRGEVTCMWYAADPEQQTCKWVAFDADYSKAEDDLNFIQAELAKLGVATCYEESRRGGHLWIFCEEPLPSDEVRLFILDFLRRHDLPIASGDGKTPGIEVFPKQDILEEGRLGNGIRGPLGVHRKDFKRYWYRGAVKTLESQLHLLDSTCKLSRAILSKLISGIKKRVEDAPRTAPRIFSTPGIEFSIFSHFPPPAGRSGDYRAICPVCREKHLVITSTGPRRGYYRCFTGCATAEIRAALGQPLRLAYARRSMLP